MPDNTCLYLPWDSEFFGYRIARVNSSRLTTESLASCEAFCREEKIDCLYFLAESDDAFTVRLAEDSGFRLVDIRITLERSLRDLPRNEVTSLRSWKQEDMQALKAIARVSYHESRFYFDGHFAVERCNDFYETWIVRSCREGFAQHVIVAEQGSSVAGFISCHLDETGKQGQIGLIGVAPSAQGAGWGRKLVSASLQWFAAQGATTCNVSTQGRNCRAQRLYQREGFVTISMRVWFHRWFGVGPLETP